MDNLKTFNSEPVVSLKDVVRAQCFRYEYIKYTTIQQCREFQHTFTNSPPNWDWYPYQEFQNEN